MAADDLTPNELENLAPGCIPPTRDERNRELLHLINAHHNKGYATGGPVEPIRLWVHEPEDRYVVIIEHPWNDEHGRAVDHHSDLERKTFGACVIHGYELAEGDDFTIGVVRDDRLVAVLWVDQVIEDDPMMLDEISREIGLTS